MKKLWFALFLLPSLFASSFSAIAQTACPQGVAPGSPSCGPGGGNGLWSAPPPERGPEARWRKTWGAIAYDANASYVGVSSGESSRRAAARAALAHCRSKGGGDCRPVAHYENQCAAVGEPVASSGGMISFEIGLSVEEASEKALQSCSGANNGGACKIFYSNCTEPVIVGG
ncbi:DUF4189 domain-containing protein [Luteimonas sp. Y-2-2-4F]|nr:DUF4189 domain-containing protein [Luteimonas sp. Y-2-2-4F]MCD9031867.1 DUF4189 domain-containing protein [Luteimonas sp. Y-2-2-4F]